MSDIVKFPYSASRRVAARRPRRAKNGTPEERAAKAAQASGTSASVTRIHGTIGEFLAAIFPPDEAAVRPKKLGVDHTMTEAEAVELDFAVIPQFVTHNGHAGTNEFAARMQEWLQNINVTARFAQVLLGKSKSEVMGLVRQTLELSEDNPGITQAEQFYAMLEKGHEHAEQLVRIIRAAQVRQLVALSSVAAEMH
jgi:hypothetical protein